MLNIFLLIVLLFNKNKKVSGYFINTNCLDSLVDKSYYIKTSIT